MFHSLLQFFIPIAHAADGLTESKSILAKIARDIGLPIIDKTPQALINGIIQYLMGLLAIVAVCFIIYGGFQWMTSAGDSKKLEKAKQILINSAIGLIIILSAWVIVKLVNGFYVGLQKKIDNPAAETNPTNRPQDGVHDARM